MNALQFDITQSVAFLREKRADLDAAIAALEKLGPSPAAPVGDAPPVRGGARSKPRRATKSGKGSAKPSPKRAAPKSDDAEPVARRGKLPTAGVQQLYCENEGERMAKVAALKADGYERAGAGVRLGPGMFDVRPSGDEDGTSVVLWRDKGEAAGE